MRKIPGQYWGILWVCLISAGCASPAAPARAGSPVRVNERMAALQAQADRTIPLQEKMPPAAAGEWRSYWHEKDESPAAYAASRPAVSSGRRHTLYIQPVGEFSPRQLAVHKRMEEFLEIYFATPVVILPAIGRESLPLRFLKKQGGETALKVIDFTDHFLKPRIPADAWGLMAVTSYDLYKNDGITGLYGDTLLFGRAGVISWYHLQEDLSLMLKGVSHECAHMLTLRHCQRFLCNLNGRITLDEFRRSPLWLCPECLSKLAYAVPADLPGRYRKLADFCTRSGLSREAYFYSRAAALPLGN